MGRNASGRCFSAEKPCAVVVELSCMPLFEQLLCPGSQVEPPFEPTTRLAFSRQGTVSAT